MTNKNSLWRNTHQFLIYPFQASIVLILGIIGCIPLWILSEPNIYALSAIALTGAFIGNTYLFAIMDRGSQDNQEPPKLNQILVGDRLPLIFQQALLTFGIAGLLYCSAIYLSTSGFYITLAIASFVIPGILMTLCASRTIASALNPIHITELVLKLKMDYVILIGIMYLFEGNLIILHNTLTNQMPSYAAIHVTVYLGVFLLISMFYLMGMVLYAHHKDIGFSGAIIEELSTLPVFEEALDFLKSKRYAEAKKLLVYALKSEPLNLNIHEKMHYVLMQMEDSNELETHGNRYIKLLFNNNQDSLALKVFCNIQYLNDEYSTNDIDIALKIARLLETSSKHKQLVQLLDGLHDKHPNHSLIPKAYGCLAKVLFEEFGREDDAKRVLEFIVVKYPKHPIHAAVLDQLNKINHFISQRELTKKP